MDLSNSSIFADEYSSQVLILTDPNEPNNVSYKQEDIPYSYFLLCVSYIALFILISTLFVISLSHFFYKTFQNFSGNYIKAKRILFVTAHPDDECMFFGPTIVNLTRRNEVEVHLMCLSEGNYYGNGPTRAGELTSSCFELGIPSAKIQLISDNCLPDNPHIDWDVDLISYYISSYVTTHRIDALLTFDDYGVSGHSNHIAIYRAVQKLIDDKTLPPVCSCFALKSEKFFFKYIGSLLVFARRHRPNVFVSSYDDHLRIKKAMSKHASQYIWFRKLFISFSSYCYLNTIDSLQ